MSATTKKQADKRIEREIPSNRINGYTLSNPMQTTKAAAEPPPAAREWIATETRSGGVLLAVTERKL